MCLIKQRANNPEQKALRRQQILNATRQRFTDLPYEDVNLNHIAQDVGMTKAALYRYFRNKETLFLALFVETLNDLVKSAEQESHHVSLAQAITNTLLANPIYCKLSAILHTILERNLTLDEAKQFKQTLLVLMAKYAQLLGEHDAFKLSLSQDSSISILMQVQQALIGVWHVTHPVGAIAAVIEHSPLDIFKQDFGKTLLTHIQKIVSLEVKQTPSIFGNHD